MKKWISLLLCFVMLLSIVPAMAEDEPTYDTTEDFIAVLKEEGLKYELKSVDKDGDEVVLVENTSDVYGDVTFRFYFSEDEDDVYIRVWNLIDYDANDRSDVLEAANTVNSKWRFVRFYLDDSDNSITASFDSYLPKRSSGDITLEMLLTMHRIMENAYPYLEPYAK